MRSGALNTAVTGRQTRNCDVHKMDEALAKQNEDKIKGVGLYGNIS